MELEMKMLGIFLRGEVGEYIHIRYMYMRNKYICACVYCFIKGCLDAKVPSYEVLKMLRE